MKNSVVLIVFGVLLGCVATQFTLQPKETSLLSTPAFAKEKLPTNRWMCWETKISGLGGSAEKLSSIINQNHCEPYTLAISTSEPNVVSCCITSNR